MWNKIKQYCKDKWNYLWSKTSVDEKAEEAAKEVKRRVQNVKEELKDVGKAIKEVGNQLGDVGDAAAGEKRKGRKNAKNK
jgi:prefoldin subunit 5